MLIKGRHIIFSLVLCGILAVSCRGPRRIPKDQMKEIYAEMFFLDQQIRDDRALKRHADTMLVYEGIFEAHGYTTDDYLYSVAYYLKDPERYAKMLKQVSDELLKKARHFDKILDAIKWRQQFEHVKGFPLDSMLMPFHRDSVWKGAVRFERDSIMKDFWRLSPLRPDSLTTDSLATDSLAMDSLAVDSLGVWPSDTLRLDSLRRDSLKKQMDRIHNETDSSTLAFSLDGDRSDSLRLR